MEFNAPCLPQSGLCRPFEPALRASSRLCDYSVKKKNGTVSGTFAAYLNGLKPQDLCYQTADFLKRGGNPSKRLQKKLARFVTAGNKFLADPGELLFQEAPSTIVDSSNKKITGW